MKKAEKNCFLNSVFESYVKQKMQWRAIFYILLSSDMPSGTPL